MPITNFDQSISWAKEALEEEAKSISFAATKLDQNFSSSIKLILEAKGKVVVTGLGKSGHVAKKIAATLSSSGTPSIFLHPAEALHGDLGILSQNDILLALTYSGETYETLKVAKFAKKSELPVIAITGNKESSLSKLSDFTLDASVEREVCPNELAPTSSTTLAMAIGDAIAVSLMRAKSFSSRDFAKFHPEGLLGRKLSLVKEFSRKNLIPLTEKISLYKVLSHMSHPNFGVCVIANKQEQVEGIITDGDVRRFLLSIDKSPKEIAAHDIMTKNPKLIHEDDSALLAAKIMERQKISSLIVVKNKNVFSGIIRLQDLLEAKII